LQGHDELQATCGCAPFVLLTRAPVPAPSLVLLTNAPVAATTPRPTPSPFCFEGCVDDDDVFPTAATTVSPSTTLTSLPQPTVSSLRPVSPICPFQDQADLCPIHMLQLAEAQNNNNNAAQPCDCYNFCNGQFVGCCSSRPGVVCDFECVLDGVSEGPVTGCRDEDRPPAGTDASELKHSSRAAAVPRLGWMAGAPVLLLLMLLLLLHHDGLLWLL